MRKLQGKRKDWGDGYIRLLMPKHSRANEDGYILEHLMIAEKIIIKENIEI